MLIKVKVGTNIKDLGYWEINTETKRALYRDTRQFTGDINEIKDFRHLKNIREFLEQELKFKHIKEIIPKNKYQVHDKILCSHVEERPKSKAYDRNNIHCYNEAKVYKHNDIKKPVCMKHA